MKMDYSEAMELVKHINHGDGSDQKLSEQASMLFREFNARRKQTIDNRLGYVIIGAIACGYGLIWCTFCCLSAAGGYQSPPLPSDLAGVWNVLSPFNHPWVTIFLVLITALIVGIVVALNLEEASRRG